MWRLFFAFLIGAICTSASAQQGRYSPWFQDDGAPVVGTVMLCATGSGRGAAPCGSVDAPLNVMTGPFTRVVMDPIIFEDITTTPKQFAIAKPPAAKTYRFTNPCDVDVRIRRVNSMTETVTAKTGILYLARTSEIVGTSNPVIVSLMAMKTPGAPCNPELLYGMGS